MINRIKSIFVVVYIAASVIISQTAISQLLDGGELLASLGLLLTALPVALFFASLFLFRTARTSENLNGILLVGVVGALLAGVGFIFDETSAASAPLLAIGMLVLTLIYVFWYSRLDRADNAQLAVGQLFPDVEWQDAEGTAVSSADFMGEKVLYLFFRGNWCPFCMAQIREVAAQYRQLQQRGVRVVLVSPQSAGKTASLARRFDVPMTFLVDAQNRVARQLGIAHENGVPAGMEMIGYDSETVLPTVLLVGENGRILYSNQTDNYRVRPEPAEFLQVLDSVVAV